MSILSRIMWTYILQLLFVRYGNGGVGDKTGAQPPPIPPPLPLSFTSVRRREQPLPPPKQLCEVKLKIAGEIYDDFIRNLPKDVNNELVEAIKCAMPGVIYEILEPIEGENFYIKFHRAYNNKLNELIRIVARYGIYNEGSIHEIVRTLKSNDIGWRFVSSKSSCLPRDSLLWPMLDIREQIISFEKDMEEFTDKSSSDFLLKRLTELEITHSRYVILTRNAKSIQLLFHEIRNHLPLFMAKSKNVRKMVVMSYLYNLQAFTGIRKEMDQIIYDTFIRDREILLDSIAWYYHAFLVKIKRENFPELARGLHEFYSSRLWLSDPQLLDH